MWELKVKPVAKAIREEEKKRKGEQITPETHPVCRRLWLEKFFYFFGPFMHCSSYMRQLIKSHFLAHVWLLIVWHLSWVLFERHPRQMPLSCQLAPLDAWRAAAPKSLNPLTLSLRLGSLFLLKMSFGTNGNCHLFSLFVKISCPATSSFDRATRSIWLPLF